MFLKDKVAIITGGAKGIGKAIAELFVKEGAKVVIADIDNENAEKTVKEINNIKHDSSIFIKTNVSNKDSVINMIKNTVERFKKIDILVNNAGILKLMPILDFDENIWDEVISINLKGAFLCTKYAAKEMIANNYGKIINISSNAAIHPNLGHAAYSASKAAINSLTRDSAFEFGKYGIRVNAILPGMTDTEMSRSLHLTKETEGKWRDKNCLKRLGQPIDQAKVALFFASELSDHVTGEALSVSAGELMRQ